MLTPGEHGPPVPPSELYARYEDQVVEIDRNVYSLWELPPSVYLVTAVFNRDFGIAEDYGLALTALEKNPSKGSIAQVELRCRPGDLFFIGVGDRGFSNQIVLERLKEDDGRTYVLNGIRSVGFSQRNDRFRDWYKDCSKDKQ